MHSALDVLSRAIQLAAAGPLQGDSWTEHGEWCTRCFLAKAHRDFPNDYPLGDLLSDALQGVVAEYDGDAPLVAARELCRAAEFRTGAPSIPDAPIDTLRVLTAAAVASGPEGS